MFDVPNGGAAQIVVIDLGGTTVRAALANADGTLSTQIKEPLRFGRAPEQVVELMTRVAREGEAVSAVVGLPGRVDHEAGRLCAARNLPATELDALSATSLSAATGLAVELAGDAELAAVGEAYFGAGGRDGAMAYLTFSTGVGAAAVIDGRVMSGRVSGFQIGFLPLLGADRSILDVLGSGQRIHELSAELGRELDYRALSALARAAEESTASRAAARAHADIFAATSAAAILMCHVCSPEVLVIGGGLARGAGDDILREIDRRIRDTESSHVTWDVEVRPALRGDDAGLVGAAAWSRARPARHQQPTTIHHFRKEASGDFHR